jgi:hypothetical protein
MPIAAASSSSIPQPLQQYFQTRRADQNQLGQALAAGNLAGAQKAFDSIVSLGKGGPFANGDPYKLSDREQDFTAVGQALQAGDLAGAQQAFGALAATFKKGPSTDAGPSSTPTAGSSAGSGPAIVLNLTSTGSATNPEQITINLGAPSSGGEETISISAGSEKNPNTQQVTLNLNSANNESIVLNLLNGSPSPTSTPLDSSANGGISVSA